MQCFGPAGDAAMVTPIVLERLPGVDETPQGQAREPMRASRILTALSRCFDTRIHVEFTRAGYTYYVFYTYAISNGLSHSPD
jgi:hypothetical protein